MWENNVYVTYCFINGGNHVKLTNFQEGFSLISVNYTDFALKISHVKPCKYDSAFGVKCLKKVGGWGCGLEQAPVSNVVDIVIWLTKKLPPPPSHFQVFKKTFIVGFKFLIHPNWV